MNVIKNKLFSKGAVSRLVIALAPTQDIEKVR